MRIPAFFFIENGAKVLLFYDIAKIVGIFAILR